MGFDRIAQAVDALNEAGLRAQRGYPAAKQPEITGAVAAVNMQSVTPAQTQLAIQVFSAVDGPSCEDAAKTAMDILSQSGATCTADGCRWDSRAGLFSCMVTATWRVSAACTVKIGNVSVPYANGVTAKKHISRVQVTDPETGETKEEIRNLGWSVTLEELLPADYMPETDTANKFTIYIYRPGGTERYEECQWIQILLEDVPGGLRRTRVARTWENRGIFDN